MQQRLVTTTIEEDFAALGIVLNESCKTEACKKESDDEDDEDGDDYLDDEDEDDSEDDSEDEEDDDEVEESKKKNMASGKGTKDKKTIGKTKIVGKKGMKESHDPIDGPVVTSELLARLKALPLDNMVEEDFDAILGELAEKEIDENDENMIAEAKEVVELLEGAANRMRRFKAGSTSRKTSFQCPQGFRAVKLGKGKGRPKCVPAHIAAGGMGSLNKTARKKAKWARGGKGKMSAMKSGRVEKRRGAMRSEDFSPLAAELMSVSESVTMANMTVRDEIVDRIGSIFSLLSEEFLDGAVTELYEDAMSSVLELQSSGRLEEDVLNEDEFVTAIEPAMQLLIKSFEKVDGVDLGNE